MTPYYSDDHVTLYHGRAEDVMPTLDPVDLVVTSPPYNLGRVSGAYANMADGYNSHADDMDDDEYVRWQRECLWGMWQLTEPGGAIFYNHKPLLRDGQVRLPTRYLPEVVLLRQVIIWDRKVGMNWSPSHFVPQHEWVMLLAHPDFRLSSRSASAAGDVWSISIEQRDFGHPCPFPESLASTAIGATAAQTVLDPFAGSGTTLVAAKSLGRKAIGIEVDERYCEVAANRLRQEVLGLVA